jgi:hypothetical protein
MVLTAGEVALDVEHVHYLCPVAGCLLLVFEERKGGVSHVCEKDNGPCG